MLARVFLRVQNVFVKPNQALLGGVAVQFAVKLGGQRVVQFQAA